MSATLTTGVERFIHRYNAYPHQDAFHRSRAKHKLLGGAAGPGKTLALIEDHMGCCAKFSAVEAPEVHTIIFRRTFPKLEATVITRFREKIPKELYRDFNESKHIVTWHNGSTTQFGAMQYEHDVWGWQGQWYKIAYDELTEFTFPQWQNISAWNRCPVSPHSTKDGATNPIGIGARWVEDLFVKKIPCVEMDKSQKEQYKPENYAYFPATYLSNPIYASDQTYIANLDSYQGPVSRALKEGIWGIAGGYFDGAWDEAYNVYPEGSVKLEKWYKRWIAGDWGFDHNSAIYWFCQDEIGIVRIYQELVCNKHTPEELAVRVIEMSGDGNYQFFVLSHDAFATHRLGQSVNSIGARMGALLRNANLPQPIESTRDKVGREQILYDFLKGRISIGEIFNDVAGRPEPVEVAKLQISDACPNLIRTIQVAPRDEENSEEIAEFLGDDPLQGAGYGLYAMFGKPRQKPWEEEFKEKMAEVTDPTARAIYSQKLTAKRAELDKQDGMGPYSGGGRMRWQRR
jgi:hypothetical protein